MDNDSGWAAQTITLITHMPGRPDEKLTLACRWVELVQAWDGVQDAYFLISGVETSEIVQKSWVFVTFKDSRGKTHHYPIYGAVAQGPHALRLPRTPHQSV
ncbi:hypothetical protein ACELLULO517_08560 [Acidisoma cellulosilytica]|uniref:Uncharacterized protein n=1 Tax=Acidisoma cellulosilyticum TaxID=2802395 RepID=A0A963Z056_9PROT|nr:hypothetical protein [Acidisoma cellulosilyticum]MCB8880281.1 hypothetical protein [Acidisoma cellulosilyticum]